MAEFETFCQCDCGCDDLFVSYEYDPEDVYVCAPCFDGSCDLINFSYSTIDWCDDEDENCYSEKEIE